MSDHHPSSHLSPERAARLLRAKAGELEHSFKNMMSAAEQYGTLAHDELSRAVTFATADIALIASLLADHIERMPRVVMAVDPAWGPKPDPAWVEEAFQGGEITREQYDAWRPQERFRAGDQVTYRPQPSDEHMREPWGPDSPGYDEMGQ